MKLVQKILILTFFLVTLSNQLIAQRKLISKDSAIDIAMKNGLKKGLSECNAELQNDTIWLINCLICDDEPEVLYDTKAVNAINGKIMQDRNVGRMEIHQRIGGRVEKTKININLNLNSLPTLKEGLNKKLTEFSENESNPVFSDNDKSIAFQYGFQKIGIINTDGSAFKQICEECLYPQWLDNDWIMYFKDFEHIYKKNIHSDVEVRITNKPYRYDDFQLSPNKKWIIYQSSEMWPTQDSLGNSILYASTDGAGENLCVMSIDGKEKKFFKKDWTYYSNPCWSENNDSIFFYISDQKYVATNLNNHEINYYPYNFLQNISLKDNQKNIDGTFPFIYHCQVFEIDKSSLKPIKILINDIGRYRDVYFSHNKQHLIYSKTDHNNGAYDLWIKSVKN